MGTVMVEALICSRCSHYWLPRVTRRDFRPKVCPSCKSPRWDSPKPIMLPTLASPGSNGGAAVG